MFINAKIGNTATHKWSKMQLCSILCANSRKIQIIKMADATDVFDLDGKMCKLLISTRLDMETDFVAGRKNKSVLWGQVLTKIKEKYPSFNLTKEQITRKFLNLRTTYKRIKARNKESGRDATSWTFFDDFDEIYGGRHSINPPVENLVSSIDENVGNACTPSDDMQSSGDDSPICRIKRRRTNTDILQYLEDESGKEQKRHEENLAIEERKLLIEERRINAMMELKEVLEKAMVNK
ncbi:uncharacterized protein LOC129253190 [Anastrepha obliqua]|nr:uncharacterized protein LOC129238188 [Anastrepha obliqua]XP_054739715.1 uncharacterized protein LOC129245534 [Anastrepha obliqua]XP_054747439.1 uncharacterized protein LOC129253190 [Anastrepha obliqua]